MTKDSQKKSEKNSKKISHSEIEKLKEEVAQLSQDLETVRKREQLALADYQNLIRRTNEQKVKVAKLAAKTFVEDLITPLSHLTLAAEQINDSGLDMVVAQLWQTLETHGLRRIEALGKEFDVNTMEATDSGENAEKVIKVVQDGYLLNDEVIQHAKVILD